MTKYYSCDSHVVEPPVVFAGLEQRFGSHVTRLVKNPTGKAPGTYVAFGSTLMNVGRLGIAGHRLDNPKTHELMARGYEGLNPGVADPAARLTEQETDGIIGEVMYPSLNMAAFAYPERDVVQAVFQRHNDWIRDYSATRHSVSSALLVYRCRTSMPLSRSCNAWPGWAYVACLFPVRPRLTSRTITRIMSPSGVRRRRRGYPSPCTSSAAARRIWACRRTGEVRARASSATPWLTVASWPQIGQLICGGVAARHPHLKFVCAEFETGWLGHVLQRLNHATYRARGEASPDLTMEPSAYFQRQFYATFEDDAIGVLTRHFIGVDNLIWGNDYPHHDSIWPHSRKSSRASSQYTRG